MKQLMILTLFVLVTASSVLAAAPDENALWENSVFLEKTEGKYREAANGYAKILEDTKASKHLKAQATLRLAVCRQMLGESDAAVAGFATVFKDHPALAKAYLLELQNISPAPQGKATSRDGKKEHALHKKLSMILPKVSFSNAPLSTVFDSLKDLSRKADPKGEGVNFILTLQPAGREDWDYEGGNKPKGFVSIVNNEPRITMDYTTISLGRVIKTICEETNHRYKVENDAVYILGPNISIGELELRFFPIDPRHSSFFVMDGNARTFKSFFEEMGVTWPTLSTGESASIAHDKGTSQLIVRNIPENLRLIDQILRKMNFSIPQVEIRAELIEVQVSGETLSRVAPGDMLRFIEQLPKNRQRMVFALSSSVESGKELIMSSQGTVLWEGKTNYDDARLTVTSSVQNDNLTTGNYIDWDCKIWDTRKDAFLNRQLEEWNSAVYRKQYKGRTLSPAVYPPPPSPLERKHALVPLWESELKTATTLWDGKVGIFHLGSVLVDGIPGSIFLRLKVSIMDPAGIPFRKPTPPSGGWVCRQGD